MANSNEQLTIAIWQVQQAASTGKPQMQALCTEIVRLYRAAGERVPACLSDCTNAQYQTEPSEHWSES